MASPLLQNKNDFSQDAITDAQADAWSDQLDLLAGTLSYPGGAGVLRGDLFTGLAVAGELALDIVAGPDDVGIAIVGELGNEIPVRQIGAVRIGVDQGITASATNYVHRKRAETDPDDPATAFVANTTGVRPANSILILTAVFDADDATSVNSNPTGRVNLDQREHTETFTTVLTVPVGSYAAFLCDFTPLGAYSGDYLVRVDTDQDDAHTYCRVLDNDRAGSHFRFEVENGSLATGGGYGDATQIQVTVSLQGPGWTEGAGGTPTFTAYTEDLGTAPVLDPGRFATGHFRFTANPNDGESVTIDAGGIAKTYEFESSGGVGGGHSAVTIGVNTAATVAALKTAIDGIHGAVLGTAIHGTDTNVLLLWVKTPGDGMTLTSSASPAIGTQDNDEQRSAGVRREFKLPARTITAEDVAWGRVSVRTPLTSIDGYSYRILTSATNNAERAYDGVKTVSGGVIEFDSSGGTDLAAGNVLLLSAWGS